MVHTRKKKEQAWKQSLRDVADNPNWIYQQMESIKLELEKDNPDPSYLREKHKHLGEWIDEIDKFHTKKVGRVG